MTTKLTTMRGVDPRYPMSDGEPMADNTTQQRWIMMLIAELRDLFAGQEVFVAGDLLWYPVQGDPTIRFAPDALVAFGRPPGEMGAYLQWEEDGVAPQVVFEVLSPKNTRAEMERKRAAYERYGVEEYYEIDPDRQMVRGWVRRDGRLEEIAAMDGWRSPRLGVRFEATPGRLRLIRPDGRAFQFVEDALRERDRVVQERDALAQERDALAQERDRLAAKLRELGIDPGAL